MLHLFSLLLNGSMPYLCLFVLIPGWPGSCLSEPGYHEDYLIFSFHSWRQLIYWYELSPISGKNEQSLPAMESLSTEKIQEQLSGLMPSPSCCFPMRILQG